MVRVLVLVLLLAAAALPVRAAETLRIGLLHTLSPAPLYLAMSRGYFAAEGLDASFRFFEAAQPIAAAAVSGDVDVGITALTGGFFSLAGRGTLKVIGGGLHEEPGFEGTGLLVSAKAWDAGLRSLRDLPGHSLAITQFGSSFHYIAGRVAEKEGFELKAVTLRPLQTLGNMLAAVRTGQVDAAMSVASTLRPIQNSGEGRIVAWLGDTVPYQITAVFAPSAVIEKRPDALHRFARAYARGVADFRAAFFRRGPDGRPVTDAATEAAVRDIEPFVFTGDPAARQKIIEGVGTYSEGGRLDVADVADQLRWFVKEGLVKTGADPASIIDTRFLGALPAK